MNHDTIKEASTTTEGLPVAPSIGPVLQQANIPPHSTPVNARVIFMCVLAIMIGVIAGYAAQGLIHLIYFFTNVSFFGRFSFESAVARDNQLGLWSIGIPVAGAIVIGFMARYGSRGVAGHGIPEAMEQVLTNQSRIPVKMTVLKPLSAAISIGTGGPYGAEGPIIATGGAVGSVVGQFLRTTPGERKTLLSAGAAAGIAAAFGCPIAATLLAVELLLFEFRARSLIPVIFASVMASMVHARFEGSEPMFHFAGGLVPFATHSALLLYTVIGLIAGLGSVLMTHAVYGIEHLFERFSHRTGIHWMWCPAIGAVAVGLIGYWRPDMLGPGYFNLSYLLSDQVVLTAAISMCVLKFIAWTISLGSGTAGGTLAPVFTIGGALGAAVAIVMVRLFPDAGLDIRVAALVGMAAIFAGASRALLTSVAFAFETTLQPAGIIPVLCGCAAAYLISSLLMKHSIMAKKMATQGVRVPADYVADALDGVNVIDAATPNLVSLSPDQLVGDVQQWIHARSTGSQHQGYPVIDADGLLHGVVTRRDLLDPAASLDVTISRLIRRPPVIVYHDGTLRDAADHMANHGIGRLPVVHRKTRKVVGILTRGDLLTMRGRLLKSEQEANISVRFPFGRRQ